MSVTGQKNWKSWGWVVAVCLSMICFYLHTVGEKKRLVHHFVQRLEQMDDELQHLKIQKEELALAVVSKGEPAWIEMVLMRDLGLVPEGWLKVHFKK